MPKETKTVFEERGGGGWGDLVHSLIFSFDPMKQHNRKLMISNEYS
jgi:hypothetical protein